MRNPFSWSSFGAVYAGPRWAAARPDILRRQALFFNTLVMLGAAALAYPVALWFLAAGSVLPILAASLTILFAGLALALHMHRRYEAELTCHVLVIAAIGTLLTLADPDIVDFGLAMTLMAALNAILVSQSRFKHLAWLLPAAALCAGIAARSGPPPFGGEGQDTAFLAVMAFAAGALIVAVTANRLNTAASASARAQMQTFSMLVESVKDAVVRYDSRGGVPFLSKSAETLFGCRRFELDGNGLFERVHVLDRPAYMAAISDATARGLHTTLEVRMRRDSDGGADYIWVEVSLSPVGEAPCEAVAVLRDVSARRDTEAALRKAQAEAEEASRAKSHFLATVGHELRTPLNAIVGFSDMMQAGIGGTLSPGHHEYAGLIKQSGRHLLEVVNMLLDMSKIEAGRFEIHAESFAPGGLAEPCLQLVEKAARDRAVALTTSIPDNLPNIMGDERACRQILINLLSNAVKFSHEGGTVHLSMRRQGKMLGISVSDTGIGMERDTVRRIGEPFLQEQNGLARRYEGTGLGLSIVKGLVGLHGGRLEVASETGAGTTVTVLLPVDGPEGARKPPTAEIATLHTDPTGSDEMKWLEDERKSAAR